VFCFLGLVKFSSFTRPGEFSGTPDFTHVITLADDPFTIQFTFFVDIYFALFPYFAGFFDVFCVYGG